MSSTADPTTTPSRRRLSSFHIARPAASPTRTPLQLISSNRLNRRSSTHRLSTTPPPVTPKNPSARRTSRRASRHVSRQLTHAEIAAMYSTTIKLCQDNKITARNTWSLDLIDYMPMLFKTDASPAAEGDTNFQLAGVTLDASVRIYCSRVDSVHTNAFKVLGGLSRTGGTSSPELAEEDAGEGDDNRKKRARRTGRATLESNLANITTHKLETDLAVDPLFQKMSAAFDEGGAQGMLLNNLPVAPRGHVVFDSAEPADSLVARAAGGDSAEHEVYDVSAVLPPTAPGDADVICGGFLRFYRAKRRLQDAAGLRDDADATERVGDSSATDDAETVVDFDYSSGDLQNVEPMGVFSGSEQSGEGAFPEPAFDGGDDDDVNMFDASEEDPRRLSVESSGSLAFAARRGSLDLVEAGMMLSENSEYSFFDTSTISSWAGPQHWRFRATQASSGYGDSTEDMNKAKKGKRPRGKTAMLLDFSSEAPKINFAKEFAQGKDDKSYHLSKTVQDSLSEKKVTLPEDLHFSIRSLASLFLKPRTSVRPKDSRPGAPRVEPVTNDGEGWYDFDNDCDVENFCPDNGDEGAGFQHDAGFGNDASFTTQMDLVPEPTRVEKIDIDYARVAKKVDVRQLKSGMWSQLCGTISGGAEKEPEDQEGQNESISNEGEEPLSRSSYADIRHGKSQTLQELVHELPTFVPKTSLQDVSLPYVFICLLHLANEKTLNIKQAGEGSLQDLIITSGAEDNE